MGTVLFWAITQCVVVIPYRRFGTTFQSHLKESFLTLEDGTNELSRNVSKELPLHFA